MASLTAGTIFQDTHLPLRLWFRAMWAITNQKSGMSALGLQRALGLGSYRTAWSCLHKLRRAMVRPGREALSGQVEVDETFIGGVEKGGGARHLGSKALVVIAAEADGRGIGRIRMGQIPDSSAESLGGFVEKTVTPGAVLITDGWGAYPSLERLGYIHRPRNISASHRTASSLLPRVHRVAALLKRWMLGMHQGKISHKHLDYYLNEFTFRFNRRRSTHRGMLFYRLAQQTTVVGPAPYHRLIGRKRPPTDNPPGNVSQVHMPPVSILCFQIGIDDLYNSIRHNRLYRRPTRPFICHPPGETPLLPRPIRRAFHVQPQRMPVAGIQIQANALSRRAPLKINPNLPLFGLYLSHPIPPQTGIPHRE
jgi:transposase-like protein